MFNTKLWGFIIITTLIMFLIGLTIGGRLKTNEVEHTGTVVKNATFGEVYQNDISRENCTPPDLLRYFPPEEIRAIIDAGRRNNLNPEQIIILFAIRKSENGRKNLEFGIMNPKANTFDLQAGWCAATIYKNQERWEQAGKPGDFIDFLGSRYCPTTGDLSENEKKLNKHWIPNVRHWIRKIKE